MGENGGDGNCRVEGGSRLKLFPGTVEIAYISPPLPLFGANSCNLNSCNRLRDRLGATLLYFYSSNRFLDRLKMPLGY
jgi:hypothetical protein